MTMADLRVVTVINQASGAFILTIVSKCSGRSLCRGDVTMLTYDWVEGLENPFPKFNIPHRCRNLEKVLDWVDEHRVFVHKFEVVRLKDNVDLPSPP